MLRVIKVWLLGISLVATSALATNLERQANLAVGMAYLFPVNEPVVLPNQFLWPIKASCTVVSENENNLVSIRVLKKTGTYNHVKLVVGDYLEINIHNKENFEITAVPGAEVELTNLGEKTIFAHCVLN